MAGKQAECGWIPGEQVCVFFGFSCQSLRGDDQKILAHHKEAEVRGEDGAVLRPLYQWGGEAIIDTVKDLTQLSWANNVCNVWWYNFGGFRGALDHRCCTQGGRHLITVRKGRIRGEDAGETSNQLQFVPYQVLSFEGTTRPISDATFLKNRKKKHVFLHAKCLICVTLMAE